MGIMRCRDKDGVIREVVVLKGDKGDKGDKPTKGVDYFTEADKQEIVDEATAVIEQLTGITDAIKRVVGV